MDYGFFVKLKKLKKGSHWPLLPLWTSFPSEPLLRSFSFPSPSPLFPYWTSTRKCEERPLSRMDRCDRRASRGRGTSDKEWISLLHLGAQGYNEVAEEYLLSRGCMTRMAEWGFPRIMYGALVNPSNQRMKRRILFLTALFLFFGFDFSKTAREMQEVDQLIA